MPKSKHQVTSRDLVVAAIFGLFIWAYGSAIKREDNNTLTGYNGAILTAFAAAWGYHLGSSKGAAENREALNSLATQPSISAPQATSQTVNVEAADPKP